jgi:hypothetical protein
MTSASTPLATRPPCSRSLSRSPPSVGLTPSVS